MRRRGAFGGWRYALDPSAPSPAGPFEGRIPEGGEISGAILADQLKSLDWRARRAERAGEVSDEVMHDVVARVLPLIGSDA